MSSPVIVWFRSDLRVHDHPALSAAIREGGAVVPVFIFDDTLLKGKQASANRNRFLIESLEDLRKSLRKLGGDLVIRHGDPITELDLLAQETGAKKVYYTADYTPFAIQRDKSVEIELTKNDIEVRGFGGALTINSVQKLLTKSGTPFKVFTPFWRAWSQVERRAVAPVPTSIDIPKIKMGSIPSLASVTESSKLSRNVVKGGETEGRKRLKKFIDEYISQYHQNNNEMGTEGTSRLSPYLHFGCISVREIETMLPDNQGADAWHRQLAWRDFYNYVLFHFPHPEREFQERYRSFDWSSAPELLKAWKEGGTGYPVVDAAMKQLMDEGWMHNRARLIVGSFLTKDLGIDWREGEKYFMHWLLDGDMANNNGNWQWIASVGVDPAPVFRRLYNPSSQRDRYDSTGVYVRKYIPALKHVPDEFLSEPWKMSDEQQMQYKCTIGKDYPAPIVDHKEARALALERYRS
jgi:deoxyribodipyrimidine photo-lyase